MSLNAAATSASSSLSPAFTCTPVSPAAMRRAASRSRRSGRTASPAMITEMSDTIATMIADDSASLLREVVDRGERLARVDLGDDRPLQAVRPNGRVGRDGLGAEVVARRDGADVARQRLAHRLGAHRLQQQASRRSTRRGRPPPAGARPRPRVGCSPSGSSTRCATPTASSGCRRRPPGTPRRSRRVRSPSSGRCRS